MNGMDVSIKGHRAWVEYPGQTATGGGMMTKQRYRFVCKTCGATTRRITVRSKNWRLINGYAYHKCLGQDKPRLLNKATLQELPLEVG